MVIHNILNKMSQKVYLLSRIGKNFNIYVYLTLIIYNNCFTTCSSVLFMLPAYKVHEIQIVQRDQQGLKLLAANDSKIFPKYESFLCVSVGTRCKL
jgi:hypothetical protein